MILVLESVNSEEGLQYHTEIKYPSVFESYSAVSWIIFSNTRELMKEQRQISWRGMGA